MPIDYDALPAQQKYWLDALIGARGSPEKRFFDKRKKRFLEDHYLDEPLDFDYFRDRERWAQLVDYLSYKERDRNPAAAAVLKEFANYIDRAAAKRHSLTLGSFLELLADRELYEEAVVRPNRAAARALQKPRPLDPAGFGDPITG